MDLLEPVLVLDILDMLRGWVQVAQSPQFPEGIRQLAAEFLVTLCEARERAPGMMRKLPQYISQLFSCMLLFLLDVTVRFRLLLLYYHSPHLHGAESQSVPMCVMPSMLAFRGNISVIHQVVCKA